MSSELIISPYGTSCYDVNSLISGDPTQPEWRVDSANNTRQLNRSLDAGGGAAWLLNAAGSAGANGAYTTAFVAPAGVASVIVTALLSSSSGTSSVKLIQTDFGLVTPIVSQRFTITTTPSLCTIALTVVPGSTYGVVVQVNDLGQQARAYLWSIAARPVASSGLFAADFIRIRNSAALMGPTSLAPVWFQDWCPLHSRMADIDILTDAGRLAIESYMNELTVFEPVYHSILVNNRPWARTGLYPQGLTINECVLPACAGDPDVRPVTIRARAGSLIGTGCYVRALYLPLDSRVRIAPAPPLQRMVVVGDSIATGYNCVDPLVASWVPALRQRYPGAVLCDASGARQLRDEAVDAAHQLSFAQSIARYDPADVWICLGTNDYFYAGWNAAAFGVAYAAVLDNLHAAAPGARVRCQTPLKRTAPAVETANAVGSTLGDYRAQIVTAVGTRTSFATLVDGTAVAFPQTMDPADGVHPDTNGHGQYAAAVIAILVAAGVM